MYKKIGRVKCTLLLILFLGLTLVLSPQECPKSDLTGVDEIYESIRWSDPKYEWEESIVTFTNQGMTLVCSLTLPTTEKLCPIVITLNGFTGNRNGVPVAGTDELFFCRTTRILAQQGIASLRVDFRGSGDSDGQYWMTTFSTQISDALAAVEYINNNLKHRVNTESIGIIGFSQGGLVGSCAAAIEKRIDSLVLWSAPGHPPIDYEGLITRQGFYQAWDLNPGEIISLPLYLGGVYIYDVELTKAFFEDMFNIQPLAEIRDYPGPLMYIAGTEDIVVWPQPNVGAAFLKYHEGIEKMVVLDADHSFNFGIDSLRLDDAIYWSTAWFIHTLHYVKK